jgi:hypothetical protein
MNRRTLLIASLGVGLLSIDSQSATAYDGGKGKGNKRNQNDDDQGKDENSHRFRHEDYAIVQRYYSGPRDLPPRITEEILSHR